MAAVVPGNRLARLRHAMLVFLECRLDSARGRYSAGESLGTTETRYASLAILPVG